MSPHKFVLRLLPVCERDRPVAGLLYFIKPKRVRLLLAADLAELPDIAERVERVLLLAVKDQAG
jgi:hypothetical protein